MYTRCLLLLVRAYKPCEYVSDKLFPDFLGKKTGETQNRLWFFPLSENLEQFVNDGC